MRRLYELLLQNPILIFIVLAWVAGMVGNVVKSARKSRERAEQQRRMPQAGRPPVSSTVQPGAPAPPRATRTAPLAKPPMKPPAPKPKLRRLVEPERAPTPVQPTTQQRRLELHIDPHVGEQIGKHEVTSQPRAEAEAIGSLGGRVQRRHRAQRVAERYPRTNLRQALVLSEILGPPSALRPPDPSRLR